MKWSHWTLVAVCLGHAVCATLPPLGTVDALSVVTAAPEVVDDYELAKRGRDAKVNKDFQKLKDQKLMLADGKLLEEDVPKVWVYTHSDGEKEIITPTVIALVTFYNKPPKVDTDLQPWVSLNKQGQPKVITPQRAGNGVKKGYPTYGTWFAVPTQETHTVKGEEHVIDTYADEDEWEHKFDPLLRCTPERYGKKGKAKDKSTEPFCNPVEENKPYLVNHTYFITWYSGFFKNDENDDATASKVKVHLTAVKQAALRKGLKRDLVGSVKDSVKDTVNRLTKRSKEIEYGGKAAPKPFFSSEWILNTRGWYPLEIQEEWLGKEEQRSVLILIQPDYTTDEDFNVMHKYVVIPIRRKTLVDKKNNKDIDSLEEKQANRYLGIHDEDEDHYEKYYVMMAIPTCVMIAALGMYLFVFINRKLTDLSGLKRRSYARDKTTKRKLPWTLKKKRGGYSELPQFNEGSSTKHE